MNPFSLEGQTALITGANAGIGQAIAIAMANAGAEVIAASRSNCDETLKLLGEQGRGLDLDFADPMAAKDVFEHEQIDILVNNAGIIRRADAVGFTETDWDDVIDVNVKALFFTCQVFAKAALPRKRGKIVNIASLLSFQGGTRVPSYTASKHAVAGLTKSMANEWAAGGLNVNAIAPGYIETNNTKDLRADPARYQAILDRIPAGRWGQPEDIAQTAVFLAAPASDYVNGAILNVDGGWLAR